MLIVLTALSVFLAPKTGRAASAEPAEIRHLARTRPAPNFRPSHAVGLRWARDTEWTVLALTDPWDLRPDDPLPSGGPLAGLARMDLREDAWRATPYAATTLASAFAALATRGIPVFAEIRDFKTIRTHRLGCYFKGRGGGLVWRLEF